MNTTIALPNSQTHNLALALLRVVLGVIFIAHGGQKLFVFGIDGVTAGFSSAGIPLAGVAAPAVAVVEFLGGFALVVGLLTRVASAGLALTMLGATLLVHLPAGFFLPNGFEFTLVLFAATGALALLGGGTLSLDAVIAGRRSVESRYTL